jgi:zinc protease
LSSVERIRREDLVSFHSTYYHPGNFIMALAGDFDADSIVQAVAAAFDRWEMTDVDFPPVPTLESSPGPRIHHIDRKTSQSTILMGHLSIHRTDPDLFPLLMANRILGASGFTSRLFREVREERGMAYYVASRLSPGNIGRGEFYLICQTEGSKTVRAIELMLLEVQRMREGVEKTELEDARESMKNEFVFTFESPLQIARNEAFLEFYDLPRDYYDNYIDNVDRITIETLREATTRWFLPEEMEILVIGDSSQFNRSLDELGEVERIEFGK